MRYFSLLSIICCAIMLMSNANLQNQNSQNTQSQFDGFAFKSAGFDVLLDLPDTPFDYKGIEVPEHYDLIDSLRKFDVLVGEFGFGNPMADIEIENNAATLGRVIFYDQNMSFNKTVSCASCHNQAKGFADDKAFSEGFDGVLTHRNTLNISDFKTSFYPGLFWDDRTEDIREASILPLLNSEEMGMTMSEIINRMEETDYYPDLFSKAYQSNEITDDKIAEALAQFLVSISSYESKYDDGFENNFEDFTDSELNGMNIFKTHCDNCHSDIVPQISAANPDYGYDYYGYGYYGFDDEIGFGISIFNFFFEAAFFNGPHNTGLDLTLNDLGVASTTGEKLDAGKFKTPGLKNVALSAPYMHDGRFETLEEVIDFYSEDLLAHPNSTFVNDTTTYQEVDTLPLPFTGFKFDDTEKEDLVAFLHTLTDEKMIINPIFSDPFVRVISAVNELTEVDQFKAYPNPFTHVINVDFNNPKGALATVKLFDLKGQLIKHGLTTSSTYLLERDNLPAGTYIVEVLVDDKTSNTRIVAK